MHHAAFPTVDVSAVSSIVNFPNEAEYLVVLYTAIKVVESLMISEEDPELFIPIITILKQDYDKGIQMLAAPYIPPQPKGDSK